MTDARAEADGLAHAVADGYAAYWDSRPADEKRPPPFPRLSEKGRRRWRIAAVAASVAVDGDPAEAAFLAYWGTGPAHWSATKPPARLSWAAFARAVRRTLALPLSGGSPLPTDTCTAAPKEAAHD